MVKLNRQVLWIAVVAIASLGIGANRLCHAAAIDIQAGYDLTYTQTAFLNYPNPTPPPPSFLIPFTGFPLNTFAFPGVVPTPSFVGITDTIIHRTTGGTLTNDGDTLTTPIEVVALSLTTNFMGTDLFATLGATPSVGTMDITYNGVNGGTWTNDFTVYVDIHAGDPQGAIIYQTTKHFVGHGDWSTTPGPYNSDLIIDGVNKDGNFWLVGPAFHDAGEGTVHVVKDISSVPEPSSALLLCSGIVFAGFYRSRRRSA